MKRSSSPQSPPDAIVARLFAPAAFVVCCVLLTGIGGAALAQTGNLADPSPTAAQSSPKEDEPPPGGCKPIGLTVSGEVVFPFECKEFIERQKAIISKPAAAETSPAAAEVKPSAAEAVRPPAVEEKPTVAEAKPGPAAEKPAIVEDKPAAVQDKPAAAEEKPVIAEPKTASKPPEETAPDNSQASVKPEPVPVPRRGDRRPHERTASAPSCTQYRTYNAASGTYRGFDGRTRPCR
jgi:BA14K-like protein